MPVKYTKEQVEAAKTSGLKLVTLSAAGVEFCEAVTEDQEAEIIRFILDQRAKFKSGGRATTPSILTGIGTAVTPFTGPDVSKLP